MEKPINLSILYDQMQQFDVFSSEEYLHDFNFISASIGKLLPGLHFSDHLRLAKESAFCQMMSVSDETNFDFLKSIQKPDVDFSKKILVTFHYSSYRLFSALLIAWGVPFKLVADDNYIKNQGQGTVDNYYSIARELEVQPHDFEIINAEDRTVILKCMDAIKQGYSLVFYADGNSGVGGMTKDKHNMLQIPFLDASLYVRKGIPTLASLLKTPVTTVTVQRHINSGEVVFNIEENIDYPADRKSPEDMQTCTEAIFRNLETQLSNDPGVWEGWFYYHNFIDFEQPDAGEPEGDDAAQTVFNHRYYGIGILAGAIPYIINKKTLRLTPVSREVFDELLQVIRTNEVRQDFPLFAALTAEGILKPVAETAQAE